MVDPYAVLQREGRWHLFGYCHLRNDTRFFRLDGILEAEAMEETFERPLGLATPEAVLGSVANAHGSWEVRVLLKTSMERARDQVPPMLASLEETEGGVLMHCSVSDLDGMSRFLAGLFCPFVVKSPPELGEALGRHAAKLVRLADLTGGKVPS